MDAPTRSCPFCAEEIKAAAIVCKHCGRDVSRHGQAQFIMEAKPLRRAKSRARISFGTFLALCLGFILLVGALTKETKPQSAEEKQAAEQARALTSETEARDKARKEAECRTDLQCWADRTGLKAKWACTPEIERRAKIDAQWTDTGWLDSRFSRIRWHDKDAGIIVFVGDKVQFQNGFGAWIRHTYRCTYDTLNDRVLSVATSDGKLDP
jgi:hypothetical protein